MNLCIEKSPQSDQIKPTLKQTLIEKINSTLPDAFEPITLMFKDKNTGCDNHFIKNAFQETIEKSERSPEEEFANGTNVAVGNFSSEVEYFTLILHEIGHNFLRQFMPESRPRYKTEIKQEEYFCWEFAKKAAEILQLPYSHKLEEIKKEVLELRLNHSEYTQLEFSSQLDALLEKEKECKSSLVRQPSG